MKEISDKGLCRNPGLSCDSLTFFNVYESDPLFQVEEPDGSSYPRGPDEPLRKSKNPPGSERFIRTSKSRRIYLNSSGSSQDRPSLREQPSSLGASGMKAMISAEPKKDYFFCRTTSPLLSTFVTIAIFSPIGRMIFSTAFLSRSVTTAIEGPTELMPINSSLFSRSMLM